MDIYINPARVEPFTPREIEVLQLISKGLSNREIAYKLHLSPETVKWYNKQMFLKLGVSNRIQAANKADELKLLESDHTFPSQETPHALNNLPAQLSSFVGRKKEINEIKELLKNNRLVVLTGAGGSGKTRLALKVVEELRSGYRNGVWLVELADIRDTSLVLQTIANVLNITDRTDASLGEALKRSLSYKHILLLIDNFEHLLDSAPLISELLAAAPKLSVLVTSRERLHIYGEQEYPVPPLILPDLNSRQTNEGIKNVEAIALFIRRARAVNPGLSLDEEALENLARICVRLDGLPLAIELCAPMVKVFPLSVIAERIEKSLDTIPSGPRDLPARQKTLIKTLQWSLDLLKKDEKRLFERLAVFNGGGTVPALENVCAEGISADISNILSALVNKNLVFTQERQDGEIHFRMLETVRELCMERLISSGEMEILCERHAAYFVGIVEIAEKEIRGERHEYWFERLRSELENLRAVLHWSLKNQFPEYGLRMVSALMYFWNYGGFIDEGYQWAMLAMEKVSKAPSQYRAGVLRTAGNFSAFTDHIKGIRFLDEALKIYEKLGDERNAAYCHIILSTIYSDDQKTISRGLVHAEIGLEIFRRLEDPEGIAYALNGLGELYNRAGDYDSAEKYYRECLDISLQTGEKLRIPMQYGNLGFIAYQRKDFHTAKEMSRKAVVGCLEQGNDFGVICYLGNFAGAILEEGSPECAARLLGASEVLLELIGAKRNRGDLQDVLSFTDKCRSQLGDTAFEKAWQEGQKMSFQEAVEYALGNAGQAE